MSSTLPSPSIPHNKAAQAANTADTAAPVFVSATASRLGEIDLLRFIAAMLVVLFHFTFHGYAGKQYSPIDFPILGPVTKYGYLGVELFFLISGFVILMTASNGSLKKFLASRVARLYPAYWVCCAMTFIAILLIGGDRFSATIPQFLVNLTMFQEFVNITSIDSVYWTLAVELKFYIMVAIVLYFRQIERAQWFLAAWLVCSIALEWMPMHRPRSWLIVDFSPYFIAGATCFLIYQRGWSWSKFFMIAISLAMAIRSGILSVAVREKIYKTPFDPVLISVVICIFFAIMMLVASKKTTFLGRRNLLVLGALTYPLYLIHQNLGYMLLRLANGQMNDYAALLLVTAAVLLLAYAVHRFIERPFAKPLRILTERGLTKIGLRD